MQRLNEIEELTRASRMLSRGAVVWKGDPNMPGAFPLPVSIHSRVSGEHKPRQDRVVREGFLGWTTHRQLQLRICAGTWATLWLRAVRPEQTEEFADRPGNIQGACNCASGVEFDTFCRRNGFDQCPPRSLRFPLGHLGGLHSDRQETTPSYLGEVDPRF